MGEKTDVHKDQVADRDRLTDKAFWAEKWDAERETPSSGGPSAPRLPRSYLFRRIDRLLKARLPKGDNISFLEAGCGGGRWLYYFHKVFSYQINGIDFSESGIQKARRVVDAAGVPARLECRDLFEHDQDQQRFDVVFSGGLVEHFERPGKAIGQLSSMVAPGGYLVTIVPNLNGLHRMLVIALGQRRKLDTHTRIHMEDLVRAYEDAGLMGIESHAIGSFQPNIVRINRVINRVLTLVLLVMDACGIRIEGELVSSFLCVIGRKPEEGPAEI
jgi:SAM-dependent methyltransferase